MSASRTRLALQLFRRGRRLAAAMVLVSAVAGCNRLDDYTAAELGAPSKRHPVAFAARTESLYVEASRVSRGLSANQEADVFRFVERYKAESTGSLRIASPQSAGAHLAASSSLLRIQEIAREAGLDASSVQVTRYAGPAGIGPAIRLAYDRPVAIAPECGDWGTDLGENRERLPYNDFGCTTQRNMALMIANGRDLQVPQEEAPRASEVRSANWTKYINPDASSNGGASTSGGSSSMSPTPPVKQ